MMQPNHHSIIIQAILHFVPEGFIKIGVLNKLIINVFFATIYTFSLHVHKENQ